MARCSEDELAKRWSKSEQFEKLVNNTVSLAKKSVQMAGELAVTTAHRLSNTVEQRYDLVKAVDGVDLTLKKGEIFCLLGPNGAGKTSLINALSGLVKPVYGDVSLFGTSVYHGNATTPAAKAKMARFGLLITPNSQPDKKAVQQNVSLCQQETRLWNELTVYEHVYLVCQLRGVGANLPNL